MSAGDAAWAVVDVAAHRHRNHLCEAYSPLVECIALPVESKVSVFRCRGQDTTGKFGALELLAQAQRAANTATSPYLHVAWSKHRHHTRVYLAAATLTDVDVWEWNPAACTLHSVRVFLNVSPRICGLQWHPLEWTLLIHSSSALKFVSLESPDADCQVSNPIASARQLARWNPSGTHFAITGGATVTVFKWLKWNAPYSNGTAHLRVTALSSLDLDTRTIVGLDFVSDHGLLVTTERPVQVTRSNAASPLTIAQTSRAVARASTSFGSHGDVVDLMHIKASSTAFLVLPELNQVATVQSCHSTPPAAPVSQVPASASSSLVLPELHPPHNVAHASAVKGAQAHFVSWTLAEPTLQCTATLDIPQLASPDMVATCSTGPNQSVVAIGSHLTSKTILLGRYAARDQLEWLPDDDCISLPSRQVHGLRLTPSRDATSVVVHVLCGVKPPGGFFVPSAACARPLAYEAHTRRALCRPHAIDPTGSPSSSLVEMVSHLRHFIETRFDRVEDSLRTLDRRLQCVERAMTPSNRVPTPP
ncbi:hypothetical protein H310_08170 [Aphanomyces invadans]|uniref:Uncharacterized protein n=1 Tax=Aphanomyces invadans TaxID=157072 RepID=A0A024TZB2_9STRA|nr:hypothetical protein H310_08170 [Aphanomyces invadans]ETV99495.1 hypothetical protein H310_08170 [Aphanomyces invadans]|eukprot:XP_008872051.1 hypothetical protein H310_08170 [Aphanomyces invadans]